MFSGLRAKLTISHLAVIIVAMGLSGFLLLSLLERYFLQALEDSLIAQARITAQALVPEAVAAGPPINGAPSAFNTLQQRASNIELQAQNIVAPTGKMLLEGTDLAYLTDASLQLSAQLETRIRILDTEGTVLVDSRQDGEATNMAGDPLVSHALAGGYSSRTDRSGEQSRMDLTMPIVVDGQVVGAVYLSQSLQDVTAVVRDLRSRWLLATAIALISSGIVGLALSGAIARPVLRLTQAAGAVAKGQLDQRVPVDSRDELGQLSQAFNEMTARLSRARQMQVDFVANVSHELRTPLTAVKGMVETLLAGAVDDPQVRYQFLETVEDETDRLIRLVKDLLILSRADSRALHLQREPVELAQLVRDVVERLTPQVESRGLTVEIDAAPQGQPALADPDRLEQVLVNLLDNAIKYSRPGGKVTVRVDSSQEGWPRAIVTDEGIGIRADDMNRVGERFFRADRARSRALGGSGLGLAIAMALVQAHGGELDLESREGQGTSVAVTLPPA
jgi:signal transduction histidine kinase